REQAGAREQAAARYSLWARLIAVRDRAASRDERDTTLACRPGIDESRMSENFYLTFQYGSLDACVPSLKPIGSRCATRCWPAATGGPVVIENAWTATSYSPAICLKTSAVLGVPSGSPARLASDFSPRPPPRMPPG